MDISQKGLDLIKEFEGLFLNAYLDPVGIPTIGYGTIRYPNGRKVEMGDRISEDEAESFMKFECDRCAEALTKDLSSVSINQNQCDALISFCFNLGFGAFQDSTLRRKLLQRDFPGASAEFPRWNKATENGVKITLPGLTRRRAAERALFDSQQPGGSPLVGVTSPQQLAKVARAWLVGGTTVVVSFDASGQPIEKVSCADPRPATLIALLSAWPNLTSITLASPGEAIPSIATTTISSIPQGGSAPTSTATLQRPLIAYGSSDQEGFPGNDVRELQQRLQELGYRITATDGVFGRETDEATRHFQADRFGLSEADGLVGPITWKALFGIAPIASQPPTPAVGALAVGKTYLRLTNSGRRDGSGCFVLMLEYIRNGQSGGSLQVCSGQPSHQAFRIGTKSITGSNEPLPEGKWRVGDIEWADGKDNYNGAVWNGGLGPVKIRLEYVGPGSTSRSAIEIHIDWNRSSAPGTAGCIGIRGESDFRTLVSWLRESDPRDLFVDYGLGTCPTP